MKHVAPPAPKAPAPVPVAAAPAPAPEPEVTIVKAKIREPRESEDDRPRRTERYENNIPVQPAPRPGREWNGYTWVIVEQRQQYWEPRPRIEYGGRRCAPQPPPYRPQVWGSGGRVWNPSRPGGGPQNPPTGGSNGGPQNPPTGRSWSGGGPANPPAGMSGGRQVFQGSQRGGRR